MIAAPEFSLLRYYAEAPESRRLRGRRWYETANARMVTLSVESGYTLEQAVASMSVLSPRCQLEKNLEWTEIAVRSRGRRKVGRFPNVMMRKVRALLRDASLAAEWARGPKVSAFFRAILGDLDAVTLDVWALRAVGFYLKRDLRKDERRRFEDAYRNVARMLGEHPAHLQAIVWLQIRETEGKRLSDITEEVSQ